MKKSENTKKTNKRNFLFLIILTIIIFSIFINLFNNRKSSEPSIPKVYFEGDISNMTTKADERKIKLKYISDNINFEASAKIKIQGTSSLQYEKKNYTINLYENESLDTEKNVDFGWGEQNKYCLKANWIDKTHSRNVVTAKLVSEIQEKYNLFSDTPNNGVIDGFPVEIYINNEFLGIYTWNIPKDAWMFNMDETNDNHIVFANEGWKDTHLFKAEATYNDWSIEAGEENQENLNKLNRLINFVNNSTDEEFVEEFDDYLDFEATINYLVITEFALLDDNMAKNMLLVTYDGKIWYPSLYDLDTSWGTNYDGLELRNYRSNAYRYMSNLWCRIIKLYPNEIAERYYELKTDYLNKNHIMKLFNDFYQSIPKSSIKKENKRWQNIPGYDLNQIEDFLDIRIPIVEALMEERLIK